MRVTSLTSNQGEFNGDAQNDLIGRAQAMLTMTECKVVPHVIITAELLTHTLTRLESLDFPATLG